MRPVRRRGGGSALTGPASACLAALALAPAPTSAQPVVPHEGEEVRVVQSGVRGAVHGYFVEASDETVVLRSIPGGGPIRISRDRITGMSVQRGYRNQALRGALIGIGVGVVGGVIAGRSSDVFDGTGVAVGVSVGVALPVGLVVGLLTRSPEWDGIDLGALFPAPRRPVDRPPRGAR